MDDYNLVSEKIGVAQSVRLPGENDLLNSLENGICGFWIVERICTVWLLVSPWVSTFVSNTLKGF